MTDRPWRPRPEPSGRRAGTADEGERLPPPPPGAPGGGPAADRPRGGDPPWPPGPRQDGSRPEEAFRVPFSVVDGFLAVFWLLAAQFLVLVPAMVLGVFDPLEGGPNLLLVFITSQAVVLAGILAWLGLRGRLSWRLLGPGRPRLFHVPLGVAVGFGGYLVVILILSLVIALLGPVEPPQQQLLEEVAAGGLTTWLAVVSTVIMAPVVEEVIFRGLLFQALKRRAGLWPAAIISSVLFAVVHVEVTQPLYSGGLVLLGVIFALMLHRAGNVLVPIVAHAVFNLIAVVLTIVGSDLVAPGTVVLAPLFGGGAG